MATSYSSIYERFLPKITDYSFLNLSDEEIADNLETYLKTSIIKFRYCNKVTNRDETSKEFVDNLTDEEQEILASLMCVEYLNPKLITDDLLRQRLNSKDYSTYSQANHVKEIRELRDLYAKEANQLMILYTFTKSKLEDFL